MTSLTKFAAGTALALLLSAPAYAQSAPEDEIIVTATRQAESGFDYAGSIASLSEERLESLAAVHPAEALNAVAGVNIHRGSGQEHLTAIRSPVLTGGSGAGSFLYLEDGVSLRAAGFANVNGLFESHMELSGGTEVVKGPGSVLYGSNAMHGLINVITKDPLEVTPSVDLLWGEDGYLRGIGEYGTSWETGAVQAGLVLSHDDGFREESGVDQQKLQVRADQTMGAWDVQALVSFQNLNQETAGFVQGPDAYKDPALAFDNAYPEAYRDARALRVHARAERDLPGGRLSLTPFARDIDMTFLRHFVPGQARETNNHQSVGVQAVWYGDLSKGQYILGADAERTTGELIEFQDNTGVFSFIQGEHYDFEVTADVVSLYGQVDYDVTPRWNVTGGLRADWTRYEYDNRIDSGVFGRFKRIDDREDDYFVLTPKLAVTYAPSDDFRLYGRAARGARAPQISDAYALQVNQEPGEIDIETLDSLEAGLRYRRSGWRVEAAAFYMEKDNFFFRDSDGFNVSDGETSHKGVELSIRGPLSERVRIGTDVTFARHLYEFDRINSGITRGNDVDTAPRVFASSFIAVDITDAAGLELGWEHMGKYYTDPANQQTYPGHDIFTLRGSWQVRDNIELYGRVDNLLDEAYANRADFAFGNERYFPGRPRTLFLGVRLRLDDD